MFKKWLETQENASWDQLLEALRSPSVQLMTLANQIDQMLVGKDMYCYMNWSDVSLVILQSTIPIPQAVFSIQ